MESLTGDTNDYQLGATKLVLSQVCIYQSKGRLRTRSTSMPRSLAA
jgi:hypothetical protein